MKTAAEKEKFIELRALGLSFGRIAVELRVSKQTLIAWAREFEVEISNLKALALDALHEKFVLSQAKRLETFGDLLNKMLEELRSRDLQAVPTATLFRLALDYLTAMKEEDSSVTLQTKEGFDAQLARSMDVVSWKA